LFNYYKFWGCKNAIILINIQVRFSNHFHRLKNSSDFSVTSSDFEARKIVSRCHFGGSRHASLVGHPECRDFYRDVSKGETYYVAVGSSAISFLLPHFGCAQLRQ